MPLLKASFLGPIQVSLDETTIKNFRSVNVQGLLAYLMLQAERPFSRETVAALFWPDKPDTIAKTNLRQVLYQLRKLLNDDHSRAQPFLRVTRETVQWNPAADYALDVAQFLTAVTDGLLETAVSLYTGELLAGFTCPSLEFEAWLRLERERLHGLALQVMADLGDRQLRNGRVQEAEATARGQLTLEPWSETAHRQLIEALALAGNRSGALAQFERCQEILAAELGVSPEPETFALVERVQNHDLRPVDPDLIAGRYALGEEIGRGAMGTVFRGQDSQTGTAVAIKKLDAVTIAEKPSLLARFQQEGEALRRLNHPNIVHLLAVDEKEGSHYLVMALIPGGDLRQRLQNERGLPLPQILTIALDLADALTRAHRLEILHRDIKPANVLLDSDGAPRLADFGLARLGQDSILTAPDNVLGTVAYLSPEACLSEPLDDRADIWSFGVLLFEMLLGVRPFAAPTSAGTLTQILNAPLPDVTTLRPDLPEALVDLLYRMLAKTRADRIPSVRLVGAELEAILQETAGKSDAAPGQTVPKGRPAFATPTPERLRRARHNLPAQTTPFVGREAQLVELERLLSDSATRLVTIVGPGGMGKTRLSLEAAGRFVGSTLRTPVAFPDGVFFVELAALSNVEQMLTAVATAFGFAIEKELEPIQQIINFVSNKQLLLLLDNFEHLLASPLNGAGVVTAVLLAAPDVKIIATSRQKLNLSSEVVFALEGLAFPDFHRTADALSYSAVQLFVQSAQRVRYDFTIKDTTLHHITRICRLTEGMPLGIVLAAAWIEMLSLAEIGNEIQADIDFLASEMGDLPPRQRSMRAVFDYSWALLSKQEQEILAKLSVFRGGFTREAAQAVAGATLRQLLGLVNKSLVQRDVANGRFSLHVLLRQLAAEKLDSNGQSDNVRTTHSRYYLSWLAEQEMNLQKYKLLETFQLLRADEQNIEAAWLWATSTNDIQALLTAIQAFSTYFTVAGREMNAVSLLQQTVQFLPSEDLVVSEVVDDRTFLRASLLNHLQGYGFSEDDKGQTIDIDKLHAIFKIRGAKLEEALVCQHMGYRAMRQQKLPQAMAYFQNQMEIYEQEDEILKRTVSLGGMGLLSLFTGQVEVGVTLGKLAKDLAQKYNNQTFSSGGLFLMALYTLYGEGDLETGKQQLAELTKIGMKSWLMGLNPRTMFGSLGNLAFIALQQGQLDEAHQFHQQMTEIAEVKNRPSYMYSLHGITCLIEMTRGEYESADFRLLALQEGGVLYVGPIAMALASYGRGDTASAAKFVVQAWSMPITMRWLSILLQYLPIVASLLADQGDSSRAVALLTMGRAHPNCPRGWWEIMDLVQKLEARLQAELSSEKYAAAQARGREMDVRETAVALLEELKAMAA